MKLRRVCWAAADSTLLRVYSFARCSYSDPTVRFVFLLTHGVFISPMALLLKLMVRFCVPVPVDACGAERNALRARGLVPVQLKWGSV